MVKLIDKAKKLTDLDIRDQEKSGATRMVFFQVKEADDDTPGKIEAIVVINGIQQGETITKIVT